MDQVQQLAARGVGHEDVDVVRVLPVAKHLDQKLASALNQGWDDNMALARKTVAGELGT